MILPAYIALPITIAPTAALIFVAVRNLREGDR